MLQRIKKSSRMQKAFSVCGILLASVCLIQIFILNTFQEPGDQVFDYSLIQYDCNLPLDKMEITFSPTAQKVEAIAPVMAQKPADGSGRLLLQVMHGDTVIFQGTRPCSMYAVGDIVDFPVRLTLDPSETYRAKFILVETESPDELLFCGTKSESGEIDPLVFIQCAANLKLIDKLLMTLYVFIILAIFLTTVFVWPLLAETVAGAVKRAVRSVHVMPVSLLTGVVSRMCLEYSAVALSFSAKLVIAVLVFASTQWLFSDENRIEALTQSRHKGIFAVLSLWAAFSVVGTKLFLENLYLPASPMAILIFLLTAVTFLPVIICVETFLRDFPDYFSVRTAEQTGLHAEGKTCRKQTLTLIVFIIGLTLVTFAFYLRAFNPAISSPDARHCMYYAVNPINGIDDWHPAFYILWLKVIVKICPAAEAVVFVQFVFFAYVMIRAALLLQKRGISRSLLYIITTLAFLNVASMQHLMIIWKDIPYTLSILWLTVTLARVFFAADLTEQKEKKSGDSWFVYFELIISLVWTCLFRHPGIVVFIIVCAALVLYAKKNIKIYVSVAIALALVVLIKGPVYACYDIQKDHGGGVYIGLGADIMGVYYNGGEIAEETLTMVKSLAYDDLVSYAYQPRWSNASYDLNVSKPAFIKAYIDTFLKNPLLMSKCIISRMGFVWDIFKQDGGDLGTVNYTTTMDKDPDWTAFWNKREINFFTWKLQERLNESVDNPLLNTLEWRCGIYFLLVLAALGALRLKKRLSTGIIVFLPCLSHVLSLLLSTGWSEFRYVWPIQLMAVFLVLFTMCVKREPEKQTG